MKAIDYGTLITELHVPDKDGKMADVVLGFDNLEAYLKGHPFFGANAGRVANRIANARFKLDGKTYKLAANNGRTHLHGGKEGFDKKVWRRSRSSPRPAPAVTLQLHQPGRRGGLPRQLSVTVSYTLTDNDELVIDYRATTNKPTLATWPTTATSTSPARARANPRSECCRSSPRSTRPATRR